MNNSLVLLLSYIISISFAPASQADELPSIFNGRDLTGWVVPENNVWWSVDNGVLLAKNGPQRKPSVLWTDQEYDNFVLQVQFKFGTGTVDSGVFLRTTGEQIQLGISGSLNRDMTASPYIAGKGYPVVAQGVKELLKPHNWNQLTIVAIGKTYTVWLNGRLVMTYDSETAVEKGPVGLQVHAGNTMSIEFRDICLAELN